MINTILFIAIFLTFAYAIYDQFLMNKLKGETKLDVPLKRQATADGAILIGLIVLTIYQGVQHQIEPLTLFLLATCIILSAYSAFIRHPRLLLKEKGFFYGNLYIEYDKIAQLNLADSQTKKGESEKIFVIDLKTGRRLLVRIQHADDLEKVVAFFGGYKK